MPKRLPGLATKTERARLPKSDKPVWVRISRGTGLGYRANTAGDGTWVWRQSRHDGSGNYHTATIGTADDTRSADGRSVLSYDQAAERARRMTVGSPDAGAVVSTIADALEAYGDYLRQNGREKHNVGRIKRHLPKSLAGRPIAATTEHEFASFRN